MNNQQKFYETPQVSTTISKSIFEKIIESAKTFRVPLSEKPTDLGMERMRKFHNVLVDECDELLDAGGLVNVADTLADIIVYCLTESARWGIPMEQVLHLVIDSQRTKLLDNGEPLWAEDGSKYLKGPNFVPPEPAIAKLLQCDCVHSMSTMDAIVSKCVK